jgi:hypothetical protein
MEIREIYSNNQEAWNRRLTKLKNKSRLLGWLRLFVFIAGASLPFILFGTSSLGFFILLFLFIILFIHLVKYSGKTGYEIKFASHMVDINTIELEALEYNFKHFPDGKEFISPKHDFTHDLDIFGEGSLFQYMNRTSTRGGYEVLAGKLSAPALEKEKIMQAREAVSELAGKTDLRQHFYVLGKMTNEDKKLKNALQNITDVDFSFFNTKEKILVTVFSLITFLSLISYFIGYLPGESLIIVFFAGLMISGIYFKRITLIHKKLSKLGDILGSYSRLIALLEDVDFSSEPLMKLTGGIKISSGKKASRVIKQLGNLINMLDHRMNMFTGPLLNGFFLWDLFITGALAKWFNKNRNSITEWFRIIHEIDALNSLAGFSYNHPEFSYAAFSDNAIIDAAELGHPLIPDTERVDNDFSITDDIRISIITGANMAGKSTFLRTVGVNMILAGAGTKVCAKDFRYTPIRLITSMRAMDSLDKHESYFFSELKRLKYIVDELKKGEKIFFIFDEILKGTNSQDKTKGSIELTEKLLTLDAYGIIATHDLELGKLEERHPDRIANKCFEVEFDNGRLLFDYKLRDGITHSHNATYLLKNMGLI